MGENGSGENSFEEVAAADAVYRAQEQAAGFDGDKEAAALRRLFEGESAAALTASAESLSKAEQLAAARGKWEQSLSAAEPDAIASVVRSVVERLDAPHLKPSGIEQRVLSGVQPACFGLFTLMSQM